MKLIKKYLRKLIAYLFLERIFIIYQNLDVREYKKNNKYYWKINSISKLFPINEGIKYTNTRKNVGIVLQGPIIDEENYTYNTIKQILKFSKNSKIVLSTWRDEKELTIEKIEKLGIKIIQSEKPIEGMENLNLQIVSTQKGIEYFYNDSEIEYILKLRTDQRINIDNFENKLISLLDEFKIHKEIINQKARIIGIGRNVPKYIPFSFCDMFQFGKKEDICSLWNLPLTIKRRTYLDRIKMKCTVEDLLKIQDPEMYIFTNFLGKNIKNFQLNLHYSLECLSKRFIIIDSDMLNLHWFKYKGGQTIEKYEKYSMEIMTFLDWLELYKNFDYLDIKDLKNIEDKVLKEKLYS